MENLRAEAKAASRYLLKVNRRLYRAYILKESFGQLWSYKSRTWAMKFWNKWKEQLKRSRLGPYKRFANRFVDKVVEHL